MPFRHLIGSQVEASSGKETILLRRMASKKEEGHRSSLFETYYAGEKRNSDSEKLFALER